MAGPFPWWRLYTAAQYNYYLQFPELLSGPFLITLQYFYTIPAHIHVTTYKNVICLRIWQGS